MAKFRYFIILLVILVLSVSASAAQHDAEVTLLKNKEFLPVLLNSVKSARKTVIFSYFIFKTTGNHTENAPRRIVDELLRARKRGVDVTVILEKKSDNKDSLNRENLHTAAMLAKGGIKVFFDSPHITTHVKAAVVDDYLVFLGSHNLTQSALMHNNELSVLINSPELAAEIRSYLNNL